MNSTNIQFKRTTPAIRIVGLLLCALLVSLAALTARAQTAAVIDSQGDAFYTNGHKAPAFLDILVASFTISDTLKLTVDVAGSLDALPNPPGSGGVFFWNFPLNTDNSTDPPGFPEAPGVTAPAEFAVYAQWDGTAFSGVFVDRRPAMTGGSALLYSIPTSVSGSRITITVPSGAGCAGRAAARRDLELRHGLEQYRCARNRNRCHPPRRRNRETPLAPMIWSAFWIPV
jgi:hypothetical protein